MESGAEIRLGGYRWRDQLHDKIAPEVEDEQINRSIDILQRATGDKTLPKGKEPLDSTVDCLRNNP